MERLHRVRSPHAPLFGCTRPLDLASLRAISPRIYAAPATVDDMATQLVHAATAVATGEANTPLPANASQMPPTWTAALSEVIPWIVAGVRESRHA